jgi:hypothetical protein
MAETQLDLFQRRSAFVGEFGKRAPKIVRSEVGYANHRAGGADHREDAP